MYKVKKEIVPLAPRPFGMPAVNPIMAPWIEKMKEDPKIIFVSADSAGGLPDRDWLIQNKRFVSTGIQEANAALVAAGLAEQGFKVYWSEPGWLFERAYNAITQSICVEHYHVTMVGPSGGTGGGSGTSHQSFRAAGLSMLIPNMIVLAPADSVEARKMSEFALKYNGPVHILSSMSQAALFDDYEFELGRAPVMRDGSDVSIIGMSEWVYKGIQAADILAKEGIKARVVDMSAIKPIGKEAIVKAAKETGAIVTAESNGIWGGMGSAVSAVVVENYPVPLKRLAMNDLWIHSSQGKAVDEYYHQTVEDLVAMVKETVKRKK